MLTAAWALKGDARGKLAVHSGVLTGMQAQRSFFLLPPQPFFFPKK